MPSDNESTTSDGSTSDEDYIHPPILSSSDEHVLELDKQEDPDVISSPSVSIPGPSQPTEVTWVPRSATKTVLPGFCAEAGPSVDILCLQEKKIQFLYFWHYLPAFLWKK